MSCSKPTTKAWRLGGDSTVKEGAARDPGKDTKDWKQNSICKDCHKQGHWSGTRESEKVKQGSTQPFKPKNLMNVVAADSLQELPPSIYLAYCAA